MTPKLNQTATETLQNEENCLKTAKLQEDISES
jgi:hypothetical protein